MTAFVALVATASWRYRDRTPPIRCCHNGQWPPTDLIEADEQPNPAPHATRH